MELMHFLTNGILGEGRICEYFWRDQLGKLIEFWSFVRIDIVIKLVVELEVSDMRAIF